MAVPGTFPSGVQVLTIPNVFWVAAQSAVATSRFSCSPVGHCLCCYGMLGWLSAGRGRMSCKDIPAPPGYSAGSPTNHRSTPLAQTPHSDCIGLQALVFPAGPGDAIRQWAMP